LQGQLNGEVLPACASRVFCFCFYLYSHHQHWGHVVCCRSLSRMPGGWRGSNGQWERKSLMLTLHRRQTNRFSHDSS
jgi:hypothetical protein